MLTLGQQITKHRQSNLWNSSHLAFMVGLSTTQMSAIEKDKKRPSFDVFLKISKLLDLPVKEQIELNSAYFSAKYGEDYNIVKAMFENIVYLDKGMI